MAFLLAQEADVMSLTLCPLSRFRCGAGCIHTHTRSHTCTSSGRLKACGEAQPTGHEPGVREQRML